MIRPLLRIPPIDSAYSGPALVEGGCARLQRSRQGNGRSRRATTCSAVARSITSKDRLARSHAYIVPEATSNHHGGRQLDNSAASITVLPRIAEAVNGRVPIIIDGRFRRGQDVFRVLALRQAPDWVLTLERFPSRRSAGKSSTSRKLSVNRRYSRIA
jgi:hypothetical protein